MANSQSSAPAWLPTPARSVLGRTLCGAACDAWDILQCSAALPHTTGLWSVVKNEVYSARVARGYFEAEFVLPVNTSVCAVYGTHDNVISRRHIGTVFASPRVVAGVGHFPLRDNPEQVARAVGSC